MKMVVKIQFIHTNNNWLNIQGYTQKEEETIYDKQLRDIKENTRWYLDNLDYMCEYRLSWHRYRPNVATLPLKHIRKQKLK